jgi:hypothetical protein
VHPITPRPQGCFAHQRGARRVVRRQRSAPVAAQLSEVPACGFGVEQPMVFARRREESALEEKRCG